MTLYEGLEIAVLIAAIAVFAWVAYDFFKDYQFTRRENVLSAATHRYFLKRARKRFLAAFTALVVYVLGLLTFVYFLFARS